MEHQLRQERPQLEGLSKRSEHPGPLDFGCPSCLVDPNSFPASGVGETLAGDRHFAWKAGFWCGVLAQEVEIDGCGGYGRQKSLNGRNDPLCGMRAFTPLGACSGDAVLRLGGLPLSSPTLAVQWLSVLVYPCPEKGEVTPPLAW